MSEYNKVIIEIVHNIDYQSVYHLQFHPSPILFCGNRQIATGNGEPFGTEGIFKYLRGIENVDRVNIYTNLRIKELDEVIKGFKKDSPNVQFNINNIK